jgi:hypothetical protein
VPRRGSTHNDAGTEVPTGTVGHPERGRRSGRGERLRGTSLVVLELLLCLLPCGELVEPTSSA